VTEPNEWLRLTKENPGHSQWYIDRFRAMARAGTDLAGEARLIDAMLARASTVLDAGCGTGRVGGHLAAAGHQVVGVDLDPVLVAAARSEYPGAQWVVGDLAELDLPARGLPGAFDCIVCAGNVMTFVAPDTRLAILGRMRAHLRDDGRAVIGFGAGRGYEFARFRADAAAAGLVPDLLLSTWDLRPLADDSDFIVAVLRPAGDGLSSTPDR
jgi:SAM-dependent methyltransferase